MEKKLYWSSMMIYTLVVVAGVALNIGAAIV